MSLGWPGTPLGPSEVLEEVARERQVWVCLLRLLPLDGWSRMDGWMGINSSHVPLGEGPVEDQDSIQTMLLSWCWISLTLGAGSRFTVQYVSFVEK